ncbi:phage tail tube protein [Singulisphaera sp. PoT]|uniref:phage tail tube protein n=1 Tax=Singulisphaera sp. PoT TaxID=3411797 RepID=UPI003BF511BB
MARQFLRITPETSYGVFNSSGVKTIIQIDQANPFSMRPTPIKWAIRSAGGYNKRIQTGSSKVSYNGTLNTLMYGSQMAQIFPLIAETNPTTLSSFTVDHCLLMDDNSNTKVYRRYLGVMTQQAQISASESNQLMRLQLQLIAQKDAAITASDFPEPAVGAYPYDAPYVFEMSSGTFTLGSSRVEFEEFNLTIQNILDPRFFASQYLTRCKYCGRDVNFSTRFPYVTTVDRANFESVSSVAASITFANGAHSIGINLQSNNFYANVQDDLALDKVHLQSIDMEAYLDVTAGTDATFTVS